jgi:hypothetical protein
MVAKRRGVNATRLLRRIKKFIPRIIIVIVRIGLSGLLEHLRKRAVRKGSSSPSATFPALMGSQCGEVASAFII